MARRVEVEFVGDRLADSRLAQAYAVLAPERRRVTGNERRDDERDQDCRNDLAGGRAAGRPGRVAAIYARVSSDRQRREQTIQSQTAALRELAVERGPVVVEDLVFEDEGFSGATLRRPGLERLRDLATEGRFEVILCHAPDRLARRYAYQVLLLEELQRAGVEVI
ncbi:MAG: recombinase family protein [Solirubrobacteraceae bacterium]